MPTTINQGVTINFELEGDGPPLVLCHGSFGSLQDWYDFGYVDGLKDTRTLVLIDARGHGKSDKPHNAASYALPSRVSDVTAVLDALGIETADYLGYSMGGWVGFGLALYAKDRFRSLMLGGAHPFGEDMQAFREMVPDHPDDFPARLEPAYGTNLAPAMRGRVVKNDLAAIRALMSDREDLSALVPTMTTRCLLFAGTADPRRPKIETAARLMPNSILFLSPDCNHVATWGRSDLALPHLHRFLDEL